MVGWTLVPAGLGTYWHLPLICPSIPLLQSLFFSRQPRMSFAVLLCVTCATVAGCWGFAELECCAGAPIACPCTLRVNTEQLPLLPILAVLKLVCWRLFMPAAVLRQSIGRLLSRLCWTMLAIVFVCSCTHTKHSAACMHDCAE